MDEKERKKLKFKDNNLFIQVEQYQNNGNLAILAYTEDELYGDITINLPGYSIDEDEGIINAITKDSGLEQKLIEEGIIKEVITTVKYNMGKYDFVVFDMEKLKEYDPKGIEKYQQSFEEEEELE
mgnify:CR=1 FL=1